MSLRAYEPTSLRVYTMVINCHIASSPCHRGCRLESPPYLYHYLLCVLNHIFKFLFFFPMHIYHLIDMLCIVQAFNLLHLFTLHEALCIVSICTEACNTATLLYTALFWKPGQLEQLLTHSQQDGKLWKLERGLGINANITKFHNIFLFNQACIRMSLSVWNTQF